MLRNVDIELGRSNTIALQQRAPINIEAVGDGCSDLFLRTTTGAVHTVIGGVAGAFGGFLSTGVGAAVMHAAHHTHYGNFIDGGRAGAVGGAIVLAGVSGILGFFSPEISPARAVLTIRNDKAEKDKGISIVRTAINIGAAFAYGAVGGAVLQHSGHIGDLTVGHAAISGAVGTAIFAGGVLALRLSCDLCCGCH